MTEADPDREAMILEALLDFGMPPARRGTKSAFSAAVYLRDLNEADLAAVSSGVLGATTPSLTTLKSTHHNLARLLSEGLKAVEVSAITGYSQSRISILKHDPAFQELMAYYAAQKKQVYLDVHERLAGLGTDAMDELQRRIDEEPERISTKDLTSILTTTMDRSVAPSRAASSLTGGASQTAVPNFTVNFITTPEVKSPKDVIVTVEGEAVRLEDKS